MYYLFLYIYVIFFTRGIEYTGMYRAYVLFENPDFLIHMFVSSIEYSYLLFIKKDGNIWVSRKSVTE